MSNVYAHLSPSVQPLSSPAHEPSALRASMKPVSALKMVRYVERERVRKNEKSARSEVLDELRACARRAAA